MTRTVLIVDDHPSFRATARALLEAEGFDGRRRGEGRPGGARAGRAAPPRGRPARRAAPRRRRVRGRRRARPRNGSAPAVVLVSSRDAVRLRRPDRRPAARAASSRRASSPARAVRRACCSLSRRAVELVFVTAVAVAEVVGAILLIHASDHEPHKLLAAVARDHRRVSFVVRRPDRAPPPAGEPHRPLPRARRLPLVPRRAPRGERATSSSRSAPSLGEPLLHPLRRAHALLPDRAARPDGEADREATAWFVVVGPPIVFLVSKTPQWGCAENCPQSAIVVHDSPDARARRRARRRRP